MKNDINSFIYSVCFITRNFLKVRYRGSLKGLLLVALTPVLMYLIQSIVFILFLKLKVENYLSFLLCGFFPWGFLMNTIDMTIGTFTVHSEFIKSVRVNPFVLIVAKIIENSFSFFLSFFLLIIVYSFLGMIDMKGIIFLPFVMVLYFIFVTTICILCSIWGVFFSDLRYIMSIFASFLFFFTPIFYLPTIVPQSLTWMYRYNVFYYFVEGFRETLHFFNPSDFLFVILKMILVNIFLVGLLVYTWKRVRNEVYLKI